MSETESLTAIVNMLLDDTLSLTQAWTIIQLGISIYLIMWARSQVTNAYHYVRYLRNKQLVLGTMVEVAIDGTWAYKGRIAKVTMRRVTLEGDGGSDRALISISSFMSRDWVIHDEPPVKRARGRLGRG